MPLTRWLSVICLSLTALGASPAKAQTFPARPLQMVVPYPPGGSTDATARIFAPAMAAALGQAVVVENRPGAAASLGMEAVARSEPDGYTVGVATIGNVLFLPLIGAKIGYDFERDFTIVGYMSGLGLVIIARPDLEAKDLQQFTALAKTNPGKFTFGSSGAGTSGHIAFEYYKAAVGVSVGHVPYKGDAPVLNDVMGRHIDLGGTSITGVLGQVKAGKVKALAVTSGQRSPSLPDVPTIAESGVPGYAAESWNILVVRRGTPQVIVDRLNGALRDAQASNTVKSQLEAQHQMSAAPMSQQETIDLVARDRAKFAKVIREANIRAD